MANSADPDQLASSDASWSGSTLLENSGYIRFSAGLGLIIYVSYLIRRNDSWKII